MRSDRGTIMVLIVSVVVYFATFAAAFATGDWRWLTTGPVVVVGGVVMLITSRRERRLRQWRSDVIRRVEARSEKEE